MRKRCRGVPGSRNALPGIVEWFRPGEFERVEGVLSDLRALNVTELRTAVSCADRYSSERDGWYAWLLPRLAQEITVFPAEPEHDPLIQPELGR